MNAPESKLYTLVFRPGYLFTGFCVSQSCLDSRISKDFFKCMLESRRGVDKQKLGFVLKQQFVVRFHSLKSAHLDLVL